MAVLTAQFKVGVPHEQALVLLYDTIFSHRDWLSPNLGVGEPIIKPKGIDDVPIVTLTFWTTDPHRGRLRPGAGRTLRRDRAQARGRHARRLHDRRPEARGARDRRARADERLPRQRTGHPIGAAAVQRGTALGRAGEGQPRDPGRDRHLSGERRRRAQAGRRRLRRPPDLHERRGAHRGRAGPAVALRLGRPRTAGGAEGHHRGRRVSGCHGRGVEEARRERGGGGTARGARSGAHARHRHSRGRAA